MMEMNATQVRREWSTVVDSVIREKPAFIKRTRDRMLLSDIHIIEGLLEQYTFNAELILEENGTTTISLDEIDLIENGDNEQEAILKMAYGILDYSIEYYQEFGLWYSATNRKHHLPYVFKALILNDINKIGDLIKCRHGVI